MTRERLPASLDDYRDDDRLLDQLGSRESVSAGDLGRLLTAYASVAQVPEPTRLAAAPVVGAEVAVARPAASGPSAAMRFLSGFAGLAMTVSLITVGLGVLDARESDASVRTLAISTGAGAVAGDQQPPASSLETSASGRGPQPSASVSDGGRDGAVAPTDAEEPGGLPTASPATAAPGAAPATAQASTAATPVAVVPDLPATDRPTTPTTVQPGTSASPVTATQSPGEPTVTGPGSGAGSSTGQARAGDATTKAAAKAAQAVKDAKAAATTKAKAAAKAKAKAKAKAAAKARATASSKAAEQISAEADRATTAAKRAEARAARAAAAAQAARERAREARVAATQARAEARAAARAAAGSSPDGTGERHLRHPRHRDVGQQGSRLSQ